MRAALLAVTALFAGSVAGAQVPDHAVGIGVSLNPVAMFSEDGFSSAGLPLGFGNIYLPIIAGPHFKLEPEFGILTYSSSTSSSTGGGTTSSSSTLLRVGIGAFRLVQAGGGTTVYIGPRVGLIRASHSWEYSLGSKSSSRQTNVSLGLALGGEHFFSPHFSLGAEAQMTYVIIGDEKTEPSTPSTYETDEHYITNNALIIVRVYR